MNLLAMQPPPTPAAHEYTAKQREAVKEWATLTFGLTIAAIVALGIVLVIWHRQRAVLFRGGKRKKKASGRTSAWSEAGKRLPPPPPSDGSRDDTVDIDPDELGPQDIGGGPKA